MRMPQSWQLRMSVVFFLSCYSEGNNYGCFVRNRLDPRILRFQYCHRAPAPFKLSALRFVNHVQMQTIRVVCNPKNASKCIERHMQPVRRPADLHST
jgi:hypothetical protein